MPDGPHQLEAAEGRRDVRVLAVDDQIACREALREVVAAASGFVLVGEASTGEEAVEAADRLAPQVVLMDVRLPGIDGISATRTILGRHPDVVMVLVSVDDPAGEPGVRSLGEAVSSVCKHDLRPQTLRDVWQTRSRRPAATSATGRAP